MLFTTLAMVQTISFLQCKGTHKQWKFGFSNKYFWNIYIISSTDGLNSKETTEAFHMPLQKRY